MSATKTVMKFEMLPNEILIECFEYLNAMDIFYSFDSLNSRFYHLIRNIPMYLDVEHVQESTLVQFCIKMLLNTQMKQQIMSLKLANEKTLDNVRTLLSFISLDELSNLQSLTLIDTDLNRTTMQQISSMLPLLTNLRYFHWTGLSFLPNEIFTSLPTSTIETLSIRTLTRDLTFIHPFVSLINLSISSCFIARLCDFFPHVPQLQCLNINRIPIYGLEELSESDLTKGFAVHLKRLTIGDFSDVFDCLEILLKRTSSLKYLMISAHDNIDIVNASRWQRLITTSLPLLDVFKFKFDIEYEDEDEDDDHHDIVDQFQQFHSDFWCHQHHWYIECILKKNLALIYTLPYMSNQYTITPHSKIYSNKSIDNAKSFTNVTELTLYPESITDTDEYYFPNVKLLRLKNDLAAENYTYPFLKSKHIRSLKTIVNLCNLTQLAITSDCRLKSPSVILHLLKETPHLSALEIYQNILIPLFNSRELCEYLNRKIKKLDVSGSSRYSFLDSTTIVKVCQIFSNMEEFRCNIGRSGSLQLTLTQLSKLSSVKAFSYKTPYFESGASWLKKHAAELDVYSFKIKCESDDYDDDDDDSTFYCGYLSDNYYGYDSDW